MNNIKSYLKFMMIAGLVFGLCFAVGAGSANWLSQFATDDKDKKVAEDDSLKRQDGERTNILVLGVDKRPGEQQARSDTMMLVSVDPKKNQAVVISIPRDTKVPVKGSPQPKICTANLVGGPEYAVEVVEDLMNVDVDYYVEMDFNGFKDVINTLGGVSIDVPQRMYKPSEDIDLQPGRQRLNGKDALAFVRYRDYINGDIDRTLMQQKFIAALADELLQAKTIKKLPALIKQANKYVDTDMGITDMIKMASWAPGFTADSIITQTLPGSFYDEYNDYGVMTASYWIADKQAKEGLIDKLFAGETIAVVNSTPYPVNSPRKPQKDSSNEGEVVVGEKDSADDSKRNWERSKLPSPGHGVEVTPGTFSTGPDGYI